MLAAMTNQGATGETVIAVAHAALALEAPAASAVISAAVQAAAETVHAAQASKVARVVMIVPHALKSRAPWPCPLG